MADAIFPVIPTDIPAQAAETVGRSPAFAFDSTSSRRGAFQLVDGALVERTGKEAVRQWFELMLRQKPDAIPVYRVDGTTRPGAGRDRAPGARDRGFLPGGAGGGQLCFYAAAARPAGGIHCAFAHG